jgi:3-dehydroquinate dehydratase-2
MKVLIINGPNINMLGIREPELYGDKSYKDLLECIRKAATELSIKPSFFQSNCEGEIVDAIQAAYGSYDGIVINPAAYTHTSIAIPDALKAVGIPAVEVHLTDINSREAYRRTSYTSEACVKTITGEGFDGYITAMRFLLPRVEDNRSAE